MSKSDIIFNDSDSEFFFIRQVINIIINNKEYIIIVCFHCENHLMTKDENDNNGKKKA